jgi:hypothetical protein
MTKNIKYIIKVFIVEMFVFAQKHKFNLKNKNHCSKPVQKTFQTLIKRSNISILNQRFKQNHQ